jgi:hypothetical protein
MKILFVSNNHAQSIITAYLGFDVDCYETHLYNHGGGYTEKWSVSSTFEQAVYMHRQLCEKCAIKVNM